MGEFVLSLLSIYQYTRSHVAEKTTVLETARFKFRAECVEPYFHATCTFLWRSSYPWRTFCYNCCEHCSTGGTWRRRQRF